MGLTTVQRYCAACDVARSVVCMSVCVLGKQASYAQKNG